MILFVLIVNHILNAFTAFKPGFIIMKWLNKILLVSSILLCTVIITGASCNKKGNPNPGPDPAPNPGTNDVDFWLTTNDGSILLQKQAATLSFGTASNALPFV